VKDAKTAETQGEKGMCLTADPPSSPPTLRSGATSDFGAASFRDFTDGREAEKWGQKNVDLPRWNARQGGEFSVGG